jgi:two-component system, cell cycle response regulator DivK
MRILLVEDHADTRELFVTYLSSQGLMVETAHTGLQAVDSAVASPPDVIVLDLQLPGMDGWTAARHLRANSVTRTIPIIALSAHAYPEHETRALAVGCDAFLPKPCFPPSLLELIERFRPRRSPDGADAVVSG